MRGYRPMALAALMVTACDKGRAARPPTLLFVEAAADDGAAHSTPIAPEPVLDGFLDALDESERVAVSAYVDMLDRTSTPGVEDLLDEPVDLPTPTRARWAAMRPLLESAHCDSEHWCVRLTTVCTRSPCVSLMGAVDAEHRAFARRARFALWPLASAAVVASIHPAARARLTHHARSKDSSIALLLNGQGGVNEATRNRLLRYLPRDKSPGNAMPSALQTTWVIPRPSVLTRPADFRREVTSACECEPAFPAE